MTSKELRIGNFVDRNGLMEVVGIKIHAVRIYDHYNKIPNTNWFQPEGFNGIKLTPEWLTRLGLTVKTGTPANSKAVYCDFDSKTQYFRVYVGANINDLKQSSIHFDAGREWYPELVEVQHVHQLQNLYFALTGSELTLKP